MLRFSQWKLGDYACKMLASAAELERFLLPLAEAGVDVFHASTRRFNDPEFEGSNLNLAGWAKRITASRPLPSACVGLDMDMVRALFQGQAAHAAGLDALLERLDNDEFDLVAVGRALLGDPAWAAKVRDGRQDEIVEFSPEQLATLS